MQTSPYLNDLSAALVQFIDFIFYYLPVLTLGLPAAFGEYFFEEGFNLNEAMVFVQTWFWLAGQEVQFVDGCQE